MLPGSRVLSFSMDRKIALWDASRGKTLWNVNCLGGSVFSVSTPAWDPSLFAMGLGASCPFPYREISPRSDSLAE